MSSVATIIVVFADLLAQPGFLLERCVNEMLGLDCSARGVLQGRAVDPTRFLIAVDAEPTDGKVDHLFLFAGATHEIVSDANPIAGSIVVRFDENRMDVRRAGLDRVEIGFATGALAHYWGYDGGGRLEDLDDLKQSDFCDGAAGSCWETEGWRVHFPL